MASRVGEVEGLKISLASAEDKLAQMEQQLTQQPGQAFLGLPATSKRKGTP